MFDLGPHGRDALGKRTFYGATTAAWTEVRGPENREPKATMLTLDFDAVGIARRDWRQILFLWCRHLHRHFYEAMLPTAIESFRVLRECAVKYLLKMLIHVCLCDVELSFCPPASRPFVRAAHWTVDLLGNLLFPILEMDFELVFTVFLRALAVEVAFGIGVDRNCHLRLTTHACERVKRRTIRRSIESGNYPLRYVAVGLARALWVAQGSENAHAAHRQARLAPCVCAFMRILAITAVTLT